MRSVTVAAQHRAWGVRAGLPTGQRAEFAGRISDEGAVGIAALQDVERADGFGDVGDEGVDTNLELNQLGGRTGCGGRAGALAQRLDGGANAAGIARSEREFLAIDLDGLVIDMGGDLAVRAGGGCENPDCAERRFGGNALRGVGWENFFGAGRGELSASDFNSRRIFDYLWNPPPTYYPGLPSRAKLVRSQG